MCIIYNINIYIYIVIYSWLVQTGMFVQPWQHILMKIPLNILASKLKRSDVCAKESCISPTIASKPMARWSSSMQLKDPGPYGLGMAGDEFWPLCYQMAIFDVYELGSGLVLNGI